jgi:hypothetical protein
MNRRYFTIIVICSSIQTTDEHVLVVIPTLHHLCLSMQLSFLGIDSSRIESVLVIFVI